MKKKRVFKGVVIGLFMICLGFSNALAEGFSFIDISWNDSPKQVFEKMDKGGFRSKYSKLEYYYKAKFSIPFERLMHIVAMDIKMYKYLRDKASLSRELIRKQGPLNKLRVMEIDGKAHSIVKKSYFYFNNDNKLVSYGITLNIKFTGDERESGEGSFYRSLVKKYGSPIEIKKLIKKWTKDGQSLYYCFFAGGPVFLVYLNNTTIEEKLAEIKRKKEEYNKLRDSKEADSVKKLF